VAGGRAGVGLGEKQNAKNVSRHSVVGIRKKQDLMLEGKRLRQKTKNKASGSGLDLRQVSRTFIWLRRIF